MTLSRRVILAAAMATGIFPALAFAQDRPSDFPRRPINLTVMYPAGGAVDVTARTFASVAQSSLDIQLRVENRVGGAGMVGHTYLAKQADTDAYSIGVIANPFMFTDILLRNAPFGLDDFDPIATISFDPVIWTVRADSDVGSMEFSDIMEYAKEHTLQVGMNPDSMFLFVSELIAEAKGVEFNFIPFDGGRQGVTALLAGDVDATSSFYTELEQFLSNGELRAVAVTGNSRHPSLPDVPTLTELGVPVGGQAWGATRFFALPKGVPEDRRAWLASQFYEVLTSDATKEAFGKAGLTLTPGTLEETQKAYKANFEALKAFLTETGRL